MGACAMTKLFQSNHDAVVLGVLTADGDQPRKLASLADLVRHMICCEGLFDLPFAVAAAKVLDKLATADPLPGLYLTKRPGYATPVAADLLVCRGREAKKANVGEVRGRSNWVTDLGHSHEAAPRHKLVLKPEVFARAERRGVPGLLDELREAWRIIPRSRGGLEKVWLNPARVAMDYDVAKEMFGLVDASPGDQSTQAALPLAIVGAAIAPASAGLADLQLHDAKRLGAPLNLVAIASTLPVRNAQARKEMEAKARAEFKRAKDPGDIWRAQHYAELRRQFNVLTAKGSGRLGAKPAHDLLSEIWGIASGSVKTYLTKAGPQPPAADSWETV